MVPAVQHVIRSLHCKLTNSTPHERIFLYQSRSPRDPSLPTWTVAPGYVLLHHNTRANKYETTTSRIKYKISTANNIELINFITLTKFYYRRYNTKVK